MATRVFKPRALAVQQIQSLKVTGTVTEDSDATITINNKNVVVHITADGNEKACEDIAAALEALKEDVPELAEATFLYVPGSNDGDVVPSVKITVDEPGVPVEITAAGGAPPVDVDTTIAGAVGVSAVFSFFLIGAGTGGSYAVKIDFGSGVESSAAIAYTDPLSATAVQAAMITGMASVADGDVEVTGTGTEDDPFIVTFTGALAETAIDVPTVDCSGITGNAAATVSTVRGAGANSSGDGVIILHTGPSYGAITFSATTPVYGTRSTIYTDGVLLSTGDLQTILEGVFGAGNVDVVGGEVDTVVSDNLAAYGYKLKGLLAGVSHSLSVTGGGGNTAYYVLNAGAAATQNEDYLLCVKGAAAQTFTLTFEAAATGSIAINSNILTTRTNIITALDALAGLASTDVIVTPVAYDLSGATPYTQQFVITFRGAKANTNVGTFTAAAGTASAAVMNKIIDGAAPTLSEIQKFYIAPDASSGTFTIDIATVGTTAAIALPASPATVKARIDDITSNDVASVTGGGTAADPFFVTFTSTTNYAQLTVDVSDVGGDAVTPTVATETAGVTAAAEKWSVIVYGTGGTVVYSFRGASTSAIPYNASAGTLQAALEGLATIGAGQVTVTGTGGSGDPYIITLGSSFVGEDVPQLIADNSALTGTASPTLTITTIQAATGPWHWDNPENWINPATGASGIPATGDDVRFELGDDDMTLKYGLDQNAVLLNSIVQTRAYTGGIGLPRINENGYYEYRRQYLKIGLQGLFKVELGLGEGAGMSMFKADFQSTKMLATVWHSADSEESGMPAICLQGTHASNTLDVRDGDVGTAVESGQSMNLASCEIAFGKLVLGKGTAITGSFKQGATAEVTSDYATIGGVPVLIQ